MRIELGGRGLPIPIEALPDGLIPSGSSVIFTPTEDFVPGDFINLGFTHYEVMCVGAAGGRGSISLAIIQGYAQGGRMWSFGGGGGGGGMHITLGELADLPEIVPVIIGQRGLDGPHAYAQNAVNVGTPGGDGGYSAFGDVCKASGGKGGQVTEAELLPIVSTGGVLQGYALSNTYGGNGGEGGCGGRIIAGGGAAGALAVATNDGDLGPNAKWHKNRNWQLIEAEQGTWDGTIGKGGGGGFGGQATVEGQTVPGVTYPPPGPFSGPGVNGWLGWRQMGIETRYWYARNGHQGSFSYADPARYGQRAYREIPPNDLGLAVPVPEAGGARPLMPGGGGGARPTPLFKHGSDSPGYSPDGIIILRIFKVE